MELGNPLNKEKFVVVFLGKKRTHKHGFVIFFFREKMISFQGKLACGTFVQLGFHENIAEKLFDAFFRAKNPKTISF